MLPICIALAQTPSVKGDIAKNIEIHMTAIMHAHQVGASCIFFPELSLTGYEPELAKDLAFSSVLDTQLVPLIKAAKNYQMTLAVGAPIQSDDKPYIATLLITPQGDIQTYYKMHLHSGEECFFAQGSAHRILSINQHHIGIAICADTLVESHAHIYAVLGARCYVAGVLITPEGYTPDSEKLKNIASNHNMLVGIANHSSPSGGWATAGRSAFFLPDGRTVSIPEQSTGLVLAKYTEAHEWLGEFTLFSS